MAEHATAPNNTMMISLLAGIAGVAAGLLLAPRSGRETRNQLKSTATTAKDRAKDGVNSAKETAMTEVERAKDTKDRVASAIRHTGRTTRTDAEDVAEQM